MSGMEWLDLIVHIDKTLGVIIGQYGTMVYAVLFAIIFSETGLIIFPFLPGDSLLFIAGAFCATGALHIGGLMSLLIIAAVLGNTVNYWIGNVIGHRVLMHDYRWIDKTALRKTHTFFEKHGGKTLVLLRFVPVLRTFAPFVAGISDMTHTRFQFFNVLGGVIWVVSLVAAGYFFGNVPIIRDHLNTIVLIGVASAAGPIAFAGLWKLGRKIGSYW